MSLTKMDESTTNLPVRHIRKNDGDARSLFGGPMSVKISTAETQRWFCLCEGLARKHQVFADNGGPNHAAF